MATPSFKVLPDIVQDMIDYVVANSELTDVEAGSVVRSMIEAASISDAEQFVQLQRVLDVLSIDTAEGDDLDKRADDFNLERLAPAQSIGNVQISDTSVTTVSQTQLDGAQTAPGTGTITVDDTTGFPTSGTLILSREDASLRETVAYTGTTPTTFTGVGAFANNHPDNNTVTLSQQGADITIILGTIVLVPATSTTDQIEFETTAEGTILDGDISSGDIPVRALLVGPEGNATVGQIIEFSTLPFSTATVTNSARTFSGQDQESDSDFVARIKGAIQALTRATRISLEFFAIGVTDGTDEVTTANAVDRIAEPGVVDLFIHDGSGLTATSTGVGDEMVVENGESGQRRARMGFFPGLETTDLRLFISLVNGTSTSVGVGTLEDTTAAFVVNEHAGRVLTDGAGKFFTILSNTATEFTLDTTETPSAGRYAAIADRDGTDAAPGNHPLIETTDYALNPTTMEFELTVANALSTGERIVAMASTVSGTDAYTRFTGIVEQVQKVMSGDPSDFATFPGVAAMGVRVFIKIPSVLNQSFTIAVDSNVGISEETLIQPAKNAVLNYVNGLGIGGDIIISEIIAAIQNIEGTFDVQVLTPTGNVTIADAQIANTTLAIISII